MIVTPPTSVLIVFWFIFGTIIGSFLNVVALRSIKGENIVKKRSYCVHCKKTLAWYDLIPLISFIYAGGKCRQCKQKISAQYPIIELCAGLAAAIILTSNSTVGGFLVFASICLLLILAVIDQQTMLLPDKFILILLGIVIVYAALLNHPIQSTIIALLIGPIFLGIIYLFTKGQGIGLGDVKLMAPIGLLLGIQGVISTLFIAFIAGGILGIYLLLTKKAGPKTAVSFGPFLAGAAILCLLFPSLIAQFMWLLGWPIS